MKIIYYCLLQKLSIILLGFMQCNFMHMICCFGKNKFPIKSIRLPELGNIQCEAVDIKKETAVIKSPFSISLEI